MNKIAVLLHVLMWTCVHVLMGGSARAQTSGHLQFQLDPSTGYSYIVDHRFRMQQPEVELGSGPHHFSFWAPQRRVVDTTLTVPEGTTTRVPLTLPYSAEYLTYKQDLLRYKRALRGQHILMVAVNTGCAVWAVSGLVKMNDAQDALSTDRATYTNSVVPSDITYLKDVTIPGHNADFRSGRTTLIVGGIATGLTTAATILLWKRCYKGAPPVFEDKERLRFEGLAWMPLQNGGWMAGLSWTLR